MILGKIYRKIKKWNIRRHKCTMEDLRFCGLDEFYWCKICKKEFDYFIIEKIDQLIKLIKMKGYNRKTIYERNKKLSLYSLSKSRKKN
ncbi:hypothetical protein LCGC14_1625200 [marine sediment metagenome]|uniref:Uncharacterized protein n=1 Tax=marine sediment metagenome TaxID=412755 RepID=A0A0F9KJT8_9ZZZZ